MKSTAVDESLSNTATNVLFQRISTNFKIYSNAKLILMLKKDYLYSTR